MQSTRSKTKPSNKKYGIFYFRADETVSVMPLAKNILNYNADHLYTKQEVVYVDFNRYIATEIIVKVDDKITKLNTDIDSMDMSQFALEYAITAASLKQKPKPSDRPA